MVRKLRKVRESKKVKSENFWICYLRKLSVDRLPLPIHRTCPPKINVKNQPSLPATGLQKTYVVKQFKPPLETFKFKTEKPFPEFFQT